MKNLYLTTLLFLTACSGIQTQSKIQKEYETELFAWQRAQEQYEAQCPYGTSENPLPNHQAFKSAECYEKIARRAVAPVALDITAFNDLMIQYKRIGLKRKDAKITPEEANILTAEAWNNYTKTINNKANETIQNAYANDQKTWQQLSHDVKQAEIEAQKSSTEALQNAPKHTNCNVFGNQMNCTTY